MGKGESSQKCTWYDHQRAHSGTGDTKQVSEYPVTQQLCSWVKVRQSSHRARKWKSLSSVQSLSRVQLFVTPWIAARQASLSITNSRSLLKLMSIESVMPSSHLILCHPFSSCPQSLPASGSSLMSQLFTWGGQSIGVSAAAWVLPMNTQDWSLGWCPTLCDPMDYGNSPGQDTRMGSLSLLQGIFPTQGSNPGLSHCRRILHQLSHKGSPRILEWVAYPFSSESSRPRNRTGVSCIADGFFTNWATREALQNQRQHRQERSLERPLCHPLSLGPGRGCTLIKVAPYPDRACIADEWNSLRVKWANR